MRRPLLPLCVAFAVGACVGTPLGRSVACGLLGLGALLLVLAWRVRRGASWALLGAALGIGAGAAAIEEREYRQAGLGAWLAAQAEDAPPVRVRGVTASDAREQGDRSVLVLDVDSVEAGGRVEVLGGRARIDVAGAAARPQVLQGEAISVWAHLRSPRASGTPGAFDPAAEARRQGEQALGYCKSARLVEIGGRTGGGWLTRTAARARGWARATLIANVLAGPEQGLVRAMVLGDQDAVDDETSDAFRAAGTYHVLAISGAQVAFLAAGLTWALKRIRCPPAVAAAGISLALVFYSELVGGNVPVVRATVMAVVFLAGRALDLDADLVNLLALAALVLLAYRPSAVWDVGFQLSFTATLAILVLTPRLIERWPRLPLRVETALAASLAAQLALLPLLLAHFHRLSPAALLLNLAAVPLSSLVLVSGLVVLPVAALLPALASLAGDLAWLSAHALLWTAEVMRWLPALDVRLPSPPVWAAAVYVTGLLAWTAGGGRRSAFATVAGACGLIAGAAPPADGRFHVTVIDVGQGDAILLRSPGGLTRIVDAGGSFDGGFDVGEAVVAPYLWSQGVRRLDRVLVTHAHPDHAGGVPALLRGFRVGEVWEGPAPRNDKGYRVLDDALRAGAVARRTVTTGVREDWDGVQLEVVGPRAPPRAPWTVRNDDSVVLAVRFGSVSFLLTGDVEGRGEAALSPSHATVVKVPHHGSKSSSTEDFVGRTRPRLALVSAGFRNRFGHPHPEVLARYRAAGALVLRTDLDGCITLTTDGRRLWVRTERDGVSWEAAGPAP